MQDFAQSFALLVPIISEIANISGVPGIPLGVLHHGDVIYQHSQGFRDVNLGLPPDSDTIYLTASLSKAFTASTVGSLVSDGIFNWSTPLVELLPELNSTGSKLMSVITIEDCLAHRTGLSGDESMWFHGEPLLSDKKVIEFFAGLPSVLPYPSRMLYNNLCYAIIGAAIHETLGKPFDEVLDERVLKPLGMERTTAGAKFEDLDNVAKQYRALDDRSPFILERSSVPSGSLFAASGGVRSSLNNLFTFYASLMKAARLETNDGATTAHESPLKQVATIIANHTTLGNQDHSLRESSYALGWVRSYLPTKLGAIGYNPYFVESMPTAGKGSPDRLSLYHQGNLPSGTSAAYLFPETQSAVVVLANAFGLTDVPDWIAQMVIEVLFGDNTESDYVSLAKEAIRSSSEMSIELELELAVLDVPEIRRQPNSRFVGDYCNKAKTFCIETFEHEGRLMLRFQSFETETFELKYLHENVFTWYSSRLDLTKRGRQPWYKASHYLILFEKGKAGSAPAFRWVHDSSQPAGELFFRKSRPLKYYVLELTEVLKYYGLELTLELRYYQLRYYLPRDYLQKEQISFGLFIALAYVWWKQSSLFRPGLPGNSRSDTR